MMQRCSGGAQLKSAITEYVSVATSIDVLKEPLVTLYKNMEAHPEQWIILWGTAKVLSEVFDCLGPSFDLSSSELYSILVAPVLILQNAMKEDRREEISREFRQIVFNANVWATADDVKCAPLLQCIQMFRDNSGLLRAEDELKSQRRRKQLESLLMVYGKHLPDPLLRGYQSLLKDWETGKIVIGGPSVD